MDLELEVVRRWFSRLRTLLDCASNISHDTPQGIVEFYKAKHSTILTEAAQRDNFAFCVFRNTSISIGNSDFDATSTFAELLSEAHRPLRTGVRGLFRAVAISLGTVPEDQDPMAFESKLTKDVYPGVAGADSLCRALVSVMPIFPQTSGAQAAFRALLAKDATKVSDALKKALEA